MIYWLKLEDTKTYQESIEFINIVTWIWYKMNTTFFLCVRNITDFELNIYPDTIAIGQNSENLIP